MMIGIDEVGRGCWAGPLVAGAVVLSAPMSGLDDSKKLRPMERRRLCELIYASGQVGLGWVSSAEVDNLGLTAAVALAMRRALLELGSTAETIIVDGHYNYLADIPGTKAIVRADGSIPAVSAASIVAKVARDQYMFDLAATYPEYGFDRHVGYGTMLHRRMLAKHGPTPIHRVSYKPVRELM